MGSILGPQPTNEPGAPLILSSYHRLFINGNFKTDIYMQCNEFFERESGNESSETNVAWENPMTQRDLRN